MLKKILFIDNTAHHLYGQLHHLNALHSAGYQIEVLIPDDGVYYNKLQGLGYHCIDSIVSWGGMSLFKELCLIRKLKLVIAEIEPDLICSFTIKPNLYTALAIKSSKVKQVANITGLGYAFMGNRIKARFFKRLYKHSFKKLDAVFFQNIDDHDYLTEMGVFSSDTIIKLLPGSGVDLTKFQYYSSKYSDRVVFLYSGRIIADKGINELISAFRVVRNKYANTKLILIGNFFLGNPSAISEEQVDKWISEGLIEYHGMVDNVDEYICESDCVVLPSYREGMPRSLLEASSMGRPIITVDSIGCKDVVEDGVTGYMAKVKDVDSLAEVMIKFIELSHEEKLAMGKVGRLKMEREFDQQIVINKYIEVVKQLLHAGSSNKYD